jgi:hypothetical protein
MQIPNPIVLYMGSNTFRNYMRIHRGATQPLNPIPEDPPLISNLIPNAEHLSANHPLCQNLSVELFPFGEILRRETCARYNVLQHLYRYLKAFRYEERQLEAGFGPVQPPQPGHDSVTLLMCNLLGYATGEIAYRIQELYVEQYDIFQTLLQTSPQDLVTYGERYIEERNQEE